MSERSQCFRTPLPLGCSHLQHPGVSNHSTRVIEVSSLQCLKHIYPGISALRKLGHRAPKPIPQKLLSTFANLDSNFYIRVKLLGYSAVWLLLWGLSPKVPKGLLRVHHARNAIPPPRGSLRSQIRPCASQGRFDTILTSRKAAEVAEAGL